MSVQVDDSELRELRATLDSSTVKVGRASAAAVRKAGRALERRARAAAPRGATGNLAASIRADFYGDGRSGAITAVVGPTVRYGFFQERGTAKMAAQPFLAPALDATAPELVSALQRAAAEALT